MCLDYSSANARERPDLHEWSSHCGRTRSEQVRLSDQGLVRAAFGLTSRTAPCMPDLSLKSRSTCVAAPHSTAVCPESVSRTGLWGRPFDRLADRVRPGLGRAHPFRQPRDLPRLIPEPAQPHRLRRPGPPHARAGEHRQALGLQRLDVRPCRGLQCAPSPNPSLSRRKYR